jgi:hypothetical protein
MYSMVFAVQSLTMPNKTRSNRLAIITVNMAVRILCMTINVAISVAVGVAIGVATSGCSIYFRNWKYFRDRKIAWPAQHILVLSLI